MDRFRYTGRQTNEISFPLGGIGAGCVGLAGNGRLVDWEIFNRPDKGSLNGFTHFAIRAERDGKVVDARILQGDLPPPFTGEMAKASFGRGFGWGPRRDNLCGLPHFPHHVFHGTYPVATLEFSGAASFPGDASLHAWSPFIPSNDHDSSMPAACFEIEVANTTALETQYAVIGALSNPFGREGTENKVSRRDGLHQLTVTRPASADQASPGDCTITTDAEDVSVQTYWYRGLWSDDLEIYWHDLTTPGPFRDRVYTEGWQRCSSRRDTGHLAAHISLKPGERKRVRFVITWHIPECRNYWRDTEDYNARIAEAGLQPTWRNWYATQWVDSCVSGRYALENWPRLASDTYAFRDALFRSSLPPAALDAASANLSILKSPTCLRLEDGTFYGWEGVGVDLGSCEGSCTHVWNYAQALPFLFPALERSMRAAQFKYGVDEQGGSHFRVLLPLGVKAGPNDFRPCADGQFGDIIKTYRDWKISGDTAALCAWWPVMRRTIEYAWSPHNLDRWDPDRTGVLHGRQHHTLDMELFGPNAWLTGFYLAALKAASEMAPVCDDPSFGETCAALFEKGRTWLEAHLFNGEYYNQSIDLTDRDQLEAFDDGPPPMFGEKASISYWSEEHGEVKYQVGEGCGIDAMVAQWHAELYGLGDIFDPVRVKQSLQSLFRYNYKSSMREEVNPWRVFALNDEAGMLICAWPESVRRPRIPLPYAQEDMTGFTYVAASHMIMTGLMEEGMMLVEAVRNRHDGEKRNPWNEFECGSNYARAMSSYALLNAFSGFRFDGATGFIGFKPVERKNGHFRCFWALDSAWGEVVYTPDAVELLVLSGSWPLQSFDFGVVPQAIAVDGRLVEAQVLDTCAKLDTANDIRRCLRVNIRQ